MKVLDLRCARDHLFEGWFASDDDFVRQGERGLIACPICADTVVLRLPSAPRLNVSRPRRDVDGAEGRNERDMAKQAAAAAGPDGRSDGKTDANTGAGAPSLGEIARARAQGQWLRAAREAIKRTEDVGDRFPEEARRMHYGEVAGRGIRGCASPREAEALREEGIEIVSIGVPAALKEPLQ